MNWLDEYEPVAERLARFWKDWPDGRIDTRIVDASDQAVLMEARVWKDRATQLADANGYARELHTGRQAAWSFETCETSAIGRALANLGYQTTHRPSREEMQKAAAPPNTAPPPRRRRPRLRKAQVELVEAAKKADVSDELRHRIIHMLTRGRAASVHDLTDDQCVQITRQLGWFEMNRTAGLDELAAWEAEHEVIHAGEASE